MALTKSDISDGIERHPIFVKDQNKDHLRMGLKLKLVQQYVKTNVPGKGCNKSLFSERYVGCTCKGICDISTCSCLQQFGCSYDSDGRLQDSYVEESGSRSILECGEECSCNQDLCINRVVQKGTRAKFYVFQSQNKGYGLKLAQNLEPKSFVCEYAGEIVSQSEAKKRLHRSDSSGESNYLIALRENSLNTEICTYVDPKYIGNLGRFINHSCDPNLVMVPVRVNHSIPRLALFARKDLINDEELTFDYSGRTTFHKPSGGQEIHSLRAELDTGDIQTASSSTAAPRSTPSCANEFQKQCKSYECTSNITGQRYLSYTCNSSLKFKDTGTSELHEELNTGPPSKCIKLDVDNHVSHVCSQAKLTRGSDSDIVPLSDKAKVTPSLEEKTERLCFCGSNNCAKFLPFDSSLFG